MRILITTIRKCGKGESSCLTKKVNRDRTSTYESLLFNAINYSNRREIWSSAILKSLK